MPQDAPLNGSAPGLAQAPWSRVAGMQASFTVGRRLILAAGCQSRLAGHADARGPRVRRVLPVTGRLMIASYRHLRGQRAAGRSADQVSVMGDGRAGVAGP